VKYKKQNISQPVEKEPKARVPFFAQKLDPEVLRSIRGGDDMQAAIERDNKRAAAGG